MEGKKPKKKWISYTVDGLLIALIAFLGYVQISMLTTKSSNHGVPMVFGSSFLYVSTNSMEVPNDPDCLAPGTGIIISKVSCEDLKTADPILDEEGNPTGDYDIKSGDVVTFYYADIRNVDTHRLIEKTYNQEDGKWHFVTMGDNPTAHATPYKKERWTEDDLVGKVVYHSAGLGTFLTIASPDAAASAGKTAWLLPVGIIVPLILLAVMSIVDVFKAAKEQERIEEQEILEAMIAAGVDPNDEVAAETFRQKEEFKREYRLKMQEEIELAKKLARKKGKKKGVTS